MDFPSPVVAEQPDDLRVPDVEIDALQSLHLSEPLADAHHPHQIRASLSPFLLPALLRLALVLSMNELSRTNTMTAIPMKAEMPKTGTLIHDQPVLQDLDDEDAQENPPDASPASREEGAPDDGRGDRLELVPLSLRGVEGLQARASPMTPETAQRTPTIMKQAIFTAPVSMPMAVAAIRLPPVA